VLCIRRFATSSAEPEKRNAEFKPQTRSTSEAFLLGHSSAELIGSQLRTNKQAFRCFVHKPVA